MRSLAAAALLALSSCSACGPVLGPEAQVAMALRPLESGEASFSIAGKGELAVTKARLDHLLVKPEGKAVVAVGRVDAEGVFAGHTRVSYLGLERIPFAASGSTLSVDGPLLPALAELIEILLARQEAVARRDLPAIEALAAADYEGGPEARRQALAAVEARLGEAPARASSWAIRVDREVAEVLEELEGGERVRLELVREGGRLRIAAGLR